MVDLKESMHLGVYEEAVGEALIDVASEAIIARIWAHDYTVWKPQDEGISNRLGWLDAPNDTLENVERLVALRDAVLADGYQRVLWLGMGGSSLAPDVYSRVFGATGQGLPVDVLDSTAPGAVRAYLDSVDPARTLFVVATKSGTTAETLAFFRTFYNRAVDALGQEEAGAHFVAITDAGTRLDELAQRLGFRDIFRNDPTVGGRYSALTYFGMVAAALLGMDARAYLKRAIAMADECHVSENPATRLGTVMGVLANTGRDKLTLILSPSIAPFGDWVEQLVAETTGKEGKGILPVLGEKVAERPPERFLPGSSPSEPQGVPDVYGDDRLFVALTMRDDHTLDARLDALVKAGEPVVRYELANLYDLGAHMFLWELATAVAGYHLHINPFNQPNVESAKQRAREMMDAYRERGELPALEPALEDGGVKVYGDVSARSAPEALRAFVQHAQPGGYIALQAYVQPSEGTTRVLHELQARLRAATGQAVTVGYGPRFLHSTGQLHKGDAGKGLFVQFLGSGEPDVPIPDEPGSAASSITFGVLRTAQALGDRQALLDAGRRVLTFDLDDTVREELRRLDAAL